MEPKNVHFGGGAAQTYVHPLVLLFAVVAGLLIIFRPRQQCAAPFLLASILIPIDQVLLIGSLHFPIMRVMVLFGIIRLVKDKFLARAKVLSGGVTKIDVLQLAFVVVTAVSGILLFKESGEVVYQLGNVYTAFGGYLFLRHVIRDKDDVMRAARTLLFIAIFVAIIMICESATGSNPYALLGGARASWYGNLMERDGRFRAMGCFGHPLLAGSFGAAIIPLCALLWISSKRNRVLAGVAAVAATAIVVTSNSSTSILAFIGGILALCLWRARRWMRAMRWGIVISLALIQLLWKHPVWYLIAKVDLAGGSSSWHRYALIDQCIHHFADWWLIGVKSTQDWGWDMWDTANWYVGTCDSSGLLAFILFMAVIVYGFKYIGKATKARNSFKERFFLWALGCCLFANVIAFFGISYWDQTVIVWYAVLAMISAVAVRVKEPAHASVKVDRPVTNWELELAGPQEVCS